MNNLITKEKQLLDIESIRKDFPILSRSINGKPLIYFDNAATVQKPQQVIDSLVNYYKFHNANIHRGVHTLSQEATTEYENARVTVQKHINAASPNSIIFTRGTTESINLVAHCLGHLPSTFGERLGVRPGDEIIVSEMEHHSNILPWQQLCEEKGAILNVIPLNDNGELLIEEYKKLLNKNTKIVAITHVSNTLGTVNPIKEIIRLAHDKNIPVLVDGAQAIAHTAVDVQDLDADFYCFSGHKVYAPTGIGVLYGKEEWLNKFPPYQTGGGTIKTVTFAKTEYADSPLKFEAGTPNIEGAIGLATAFDYINNLGINNISAYENELLHYATKELEKIEEVRIIGTASDKAGVISIEVINTHPFDIGTLLDQLGIAVRTGHHCTQPLMTRYGIQGTVRISFAFYNTKEEIDTLIIGLKKAIKMLK